ncbi:hypothetical protein SNEBB_008941 [Seison nebaliae]|nr:hypothetical protein SNEBB_008941 [Seison nebaliae]
MRYLKQDEAKAIDEKLFNEYRYSVDQLMELAGLSCAESIADQFKKEKKILIVCGPGNNGGDGIVCGRHLKLFGYEPTVIYLKETKNDLYLRLLHQINSMNIKIIRNESELTDQFTNSEVIVDAIFGFSFRSDGIIRSPYKELIDRMIESKKRICSIDVPSGWDVEKGPHRSDMSYISPEMLISLTAPKECAKYFEGQFHYLGGRFIDEIFKEKFNLLSLPSFESTRQSVRMK